MKKWYKICGIVWVFLTNSLFSTAQNVDNKLFNTKPATYFFSPKPRLFFHKLLPVPQKTEIFKKNISLNITPSSATRNFGFFCRAELKSDAVLKVPIRFRLGSLQYCDYMEGKNQYEVLRQNH